MGVCVCVCDSCCQLLQANAVQGKTEFNMINYSHADLCRLEFPELFKKPTESHVENTCSGFETGSLITAFTVVMSHLSAFVKILH